MKRTSVESSVSRGRAVFLLFSVFVVTVAALSLVTGYQSIAGAAEERAIVGAQSYTEYVQSVLVSLDISADVVAREIVADRSEADLRDELTHQMLFFPQIETIEYYDPQGELVMGVPSTSLEVSRSLSEEVLVLHRDAWIDSSVSLDEGSRRVVVSRSVLTEGEFRGLVLATVPESYFYHAIPQISPTAVSHIAVVNGTGEFLLHWGEVDHDRLPTDFTALEDPESPGGVAVATSADYVGGMAQLRAFPVRVIVFLDRQLLMEDWEHQLDSTLVILVLFFVAGFVILRYVRRLQTRQEEVRAQLMQEKESRRITELIRRVRDEALAGEDEGVMLRTSVCELSKFLGASSAVVHAHGDNEVAPRSFRIESCDGTGDPAENGESLRVPIRVGSKNVGEVEFRLHFAPSGWHSRVSEQALTVVGGALLRKRIEGRLRDTEARLAAFMNNSPSLNFVQDDSGSVVYANPEFRRVFGDPDSALASRFSDMNEQRQEVLVDGETRVFSTRLFPFRDGNGQRFLGGVGIDITEMQKTQAELKKALEDKELLLREIHHRVKNNLAVIDSLLSFEQEKATPRGADEILSGVRSRIQAIALIHKRLYKSENLTSVPFREYSAELIDYILQTIEPISEIETDLRMEIENIELDIEVVKPLGLILHELVANAVKYARPDLRLEVFFAPDDEGRLRLLVRDYGPGFSSKPVPDPEISLGFFVVHALCDELGADLETWNDNGAHIAVRLP